MRKRQIAGLFLLLMVPFVALANGQGEGEGSADVEVNRTGYPIVDEQVTQRWVAAFHPRGVPYEEIPAVQAYEEKTNVDIDWVSVPLSQIAEQVNILVATGDLPDAFYGTAARGANWANDLGSQGLFIPLQELVAEWGPNIERALELHPFAASASAAPDGNMYSLPKIDKANHPVIPRKLYINQDWLKALDMEYPETHEEFFDYLVGIRDNDVNGNGDPNDEIPMSLVEHNLDTLEAADSWIKTMGPWGVDSEFPIRDGEVTVGFASDNYREALRFYRRLIDEDLLDIESFAQDQGALRAKAVIDGVPRVGVFTKMAAFQIVGRENAGYFLPKEERPYTAIAPFEGPFGDRLWYTNPAQRYRTGSFVITAENELPEAAVRWVDTHFDPVEAISWSTFPVELYQEVRPGTFSEPSEFPNDWSYGEARHRLSPGATGLYFRDAGLAAQAGWTEFVEPLGQGDVINQDANLMMEYIPEDTLNPRILSFTGEERDLLVTYLADLFSYVSESMARFMVGEMDIESDWEGYLDQLDRLRVEEIRGVYQAAYDRLRGN